MSTDTPDTRHDGTDAAPTNPVLVALAWLVVGLPLAYGLWQTLVKASALFTG